MTTSRNILSQAIAAAGSRKSFPAMTLARTDPTLAAIVSKMVQDNKNPQTFDQSGNRTVDRPRDDYMREIAQRTANKITSAELTMQLLPDIELAAQILISSILSPKDMMSVELTYRPPEDLLPPDVAAAMIDCLKSYLQKNYKIESLLPKQLRAILIEDGSYPVAVIPENAIDEVINGRSRVSTESLSELVDRNNRIQNLGILGPAVLPQPTARPSANQAFALEDFTETRCYKAAIETRVSFDELGRSLPPGTSASIESFLSVTDNYSILKLPMLRQRMREQTVLDAVASPAVRKLRAAAESSQLTDRELGRLIYRNRQGTHRPVTILKTQEQLNRRTVGSPLVMKLPPEAVIPVYVPGCIDKQIGFFVLIDENGNPISKETASDYYGALGSRLNSSVPFSQALNVRTQAASAGGSTYGYNNDERVNEAVRVYTEMVEQDLLARLRHGVYGNGVRLGRRDEVYRIMLARQLSQQQTQMLFLPIELVTYMAFRYNDDGVGKSLLDDMQILNSLRAVLMFANVQAGVRNSISRRAIKLKLDEHDPDPVKTIERFQHEILRTHQQSFPVGVNDPTDIVNFLARAGMEFSFEGHPGLPDIQAEFEEKSSNFAKPDSDTEEDLRKRSIMGMGVSPETVDSAGQAEFAISVATENLLFAKRVTQIQQAFTPQLSDHLRKVAMNWEELMTDLEGILNDNYEKIARRHQASGDDTVEAPDKSQLVASWLHDFVTGFEVDLPAPNSVTLENQVAAMEVYEAALDKALTSWIDTSFFDASLGGNAADYVDVVRAAIKAHYMRQWMAENGLLTELSDLTTSDEDGKPKLDMLKACTDHNTSLSKSLIEFVKQIVVPRAAGNTALDALNKSDETTSDVEGGGSDTSGDDTGGSGDGGGDDMFGGMGGFGDDLGGGDETGDETPPDDTPPNEEPAPESGSDENPDEDTPPVE